ncbi:MAG: DUF2798 domain-containing protein [Sulfurovum sp.]|nr:DUF2798 domain-containing protein [Sulfurovum sp.]
MIPAKYLHYVQAFLLSGIMSFIMSGAISFINLGVVEHFMDIWTHAWLVAWAVAFPSILLVFPFARKVALKIASK